MNKVQQDLNQILLDARKAKGQTPWEGSGEEGAQTAGGSLWKEERREEPGALPWELRPHL